MRDRTLIVLLVIVAAFIGGRVTASVPTPDWGPEVTTSAPDASYEAPAREGTKPATCFDGNWDNDGNAVCD